MKSLKNLAWRFAFLGIVIGLFGTAAAQSLFPPALTVSGEQGGNTAGTMLNPFNGSGIQMTLRIDDPDPTNYVFSWDETHEGDFCNSDSPLFEDLFEFFTVGEQNPIYSHPRVRSGIATVTLTATVREVPHDPVSQSRTFFIAPHPAGCSAAPPPDPQAPRELALSANELQPTLGSTILLTGEARDPDSPVTFLFFADSNDDPLRRGTLIGAQQASSCQTSCQASIPFQVAQFPTAQFLTLVASDSQSEVASEKLEIKVSVHGADGPQPPDPGPTPQNCQCGEDILVQVDSGPPSRTLVGGEDLLLEGEAIGPSIGGAVVPGDFVWEILDPGGLSAEDLFLEDPTSLDATLVTPEIAVDTTVQLRLTATFEGCSCQDDRTLELVSRLPETDLSLEHVNNPFQVNVGSEVTFELVVRNNGPDDAESVEVTDLLPVGATLLNASPSRGICQLEDNDVVCALGDMPSGDVANVEIRVRLDGGGLVNNTGFVSSFTIDSQLNNDSDTQTATVLLTNLNNRLQFAHFGEGSGISSQIILFNPNDSATANAKVLVRNIAGGALSVDFNAETVDGEIDVIVPPGGLRSLQTDGIGPLDIGSVSVLSDQELAGVIVFAGPFGVAGVGNSQELDQGFVAPMERFTNQINTGVALANLEESPANINITLADVNGVEITTSQLGMAAQGKIALNVNEFNWLNPPDFDDFQGLMRIESNRRLSATVLQVRPGEFATLPVAPALAPAAASLAGDRALLPILPGQSDPGRDLYFAQFADGADALFSQILLFNLEDEAAEATILIRDDLGDPITVDLNGENVVGQTTVTIPALGSRVLQTDGAGELVVGSATVQSDSQLAGVLLFGGVVGVAGVGASEPLDNGFVAPIQTSGENSALINTGIAVANLEDDSVTIDLTLVDADGGNLATGQLVLDGLGHVAQFVDEITWDPPVDLIDFQGTVRATSSGRITATVIQQRPEQFATMPVAPISPPGQ